MKHQQYIPYSKALNKAMFYCSKAEKCKSEIQKKLLDWKANPDDFEGILSELERQKFIDEERFSQYYVRDKFEFNKWGRIKIRIMLLQKKIPEKFIDKALEQISEEKYEQTLSALIAQKQKTLKAENKHEIRSKLMRFASSRGFEPDLILRILRK